MNHRLPHTLTQTEVLATRLLDERNLSRNDLVLEYGHLGCHISLQINPSLSSVKLPLVNCIFIIYRFLLFPKLKKGDF